MHDDRKLVEARLRRVVAERIRPAVYGARATLDVEAWEVPGEPVPVTEALAAQYAPFAVGDRFGRPWATTWFRFACEVPAAWAGARVEAAIDFSFTDRPGFQAEATVWGPVDGAPGGWAPVRGLHPRHHHLDVADPAVGGEPVGFLVEASSNPDLSAHRPSPDSDLASAGAEPLYALRTAELVVVRPEVAALAEDVDALRRLMGQLPVDGSRRHEILRALERMLDVLAADDVAASAAAARKELGDVMARPAAASAHRISAVGHAHIDSAWLWPIRETRRKCARTFANVLALMDRYPEFRFTCSQAAQYDWIRVEHPTLFAAIGERVAEGRWIPTGGMWVEPDVNLTGGESLVRQITFGQRFFGEHFGRRCTEGWLPDVFGYSGALPQLLRLGAMTRFLTQKLSWNKVNRFPHHTFRWEGIDGSTVFTHFPPVETYNAVIHPAEHARAEHGFADKGRATRSFMPFGHGDGGGGPNPPMLEQFRRLRDIEGGPRLEIASPEEFFDRAEADYPDAPRWVGELYFETHRGTYTSQAKTKLGNRRCELLLHEAELWAVTSGRAADATVRADLDRIWTEVLLLQFHDILPGTSIGWVHREAEATHTRLAAELRALVADALDELAGGAAIVANAAPHDRDEVVVLDPEPGVADLATGQTLADGSVAVGLAVAALATCPLADAVTAATTHPPVELVAADGVVTVDNGRLRVVIDADGLLASVVVAGREVIVDGGRGNLLQLHPDVPVEYDAWDLDDHYRRQVTDLTAATSVEVIDAGPLVARVRIERAFRSSTVAQTYEVRASSVRLDIATDIDWRERDHVLKAAFAIDVAADHLTREIQFGHVRTAIHTNTSWDVARFEVCAHRWVDAAEPGFGVALLNDGRYGHDATRTRSGDDRPTTSLRLTLLRGARYPDPHADLGRHRFTYALLAHAGDLRHAGVIEEGYRLNLGVRVVPAGGAAAEGPGRPVGALVWSEHPGVVVGTVKAADDGSGDLIVRVHEAWGDRLPLRLHLARPPVSVGVVDLLEEPDDRLPAVGLAVTDTVVTGELRPFQIVTLRIRS